MSEDDTSAEVGKVLEKIRSRLSQQGPTSQPAEPGSAASAFSSPAAAANTTVVLHQLLAAVQAAHAQVGLINPRPAGLHNQLIQLVKKVLRRLLTWYTRPLIQYQALNIQFLNQATQIIERQQAQLRWLQEELEALRAERRQGKEAVPSDERHEVKKAEAKSESTGASASRG
jgi:hypothetical protein